MKTKTGSVHGIENIHCKWSDISDIMNYQIVILKANTILQVKT